jgi:DNA-binding transcriptional regulator YdaS (Cro superfamily)
MKLLDYLKKQNIADHAFAETVGRSRSAVRKWMYGQRIPRPAEMLAIKEATDGKVTADDFMHAPPKVAHHMAQVAQ